MINEYLMDDDENKSTNAAEALTIMKQYFTKTKEQK